MTSEFENEDIRAEAQRLVDEVHGAKVDPGEERSLRYTLQVLETHASSVEAATVTVSNLMGVGSFTYSYGICCCAGQGGSEGIVDALQEVTSRIKAIVRQEHKNDGRNLTSKYTTLSMAMPMLVWSVHCCACLEIWLD